MLETNTADLPFLVDSVGAELAARGLRIVRVTHPIVGVRRDPAPPHRITAIEHPREAPRESVMHFELDRRLSPEELADLEDAARHVLATVRAVVDDFPRAAGRPRAPGRDRRRRRRAAGRGRAGPRGGGGVPALGRRRSLRLPRLPRGRARRRGPPARGAVRPRTGLGLLRDTREAGELRVPAHDPPAADGHARDAAVLEITKTHALSPVHRREPMNVLIARRFADDGTVIGEARLLGLFTSRAYGEPASTTPLLRDKLRRILDAEDLIDGSHDSKAAIALFDSYPEGRAVRRAVPGDPRAAVGPAGAARRRGAPARPPRPRRPRRRARRRPAARALQRHAARAPARDGRVGAYGTDHVEQHEVFGEDDRVYLHLTVDGGGGLPDVDVAELERRLILEARTWRDRVGGALVHRHGPERGRMLAARWLKRLPESYRAAVEPLTAAEDVERFEALANGRADFLVGLQDERGRGRPPGARASPSTGAGRRSSCRRPRRCWSTWACA